MWYFWLLPELLGGASRMPRVVSGAVYKLFTRFSRFIPRHSISCLDVTHTFARDPYHEDG
jgi:hypothetical protein